VYIYIHWPLYCNCAYIRNYHCNCTTNGDLRLGRHTSSTFLYVNGFWLVFVCSFCSLTEWVMFHWTTLIGLYWVYVYIYIHIIIYIYIYDVYIYTHMYMWVSCRVHLDPVACKIMLEMVDDSLSSHQVTWFFPGLHRVVWAFWWT
jgi:uncharacterized membrane protein